MKRPERDKLRRRLRGAEAGCAIVALGLEDKRPLGATDAQTMIRILGEVAVVLADATAALGGVA